MHARELLGLDWKYIELRFEFVTNQKSQFQGKTEYENCREPVMFRVEHSAIIIV